MEEQFIIQKSFNDGQSFARFSDPTKSVFITVYLRYFIIVSVLQGRKFIR